MMTTDRELMHRVATGDEPAFTELSNRYSARLLTMAWRLLGNRADAEDAVQRALDRVPLEARILLALRYMDGLSYRELARVRGISVNTVKSQLARGKSIVRKILQKGGAGRRTAGASTKGAE